MVTPEFRSDDVRAVRHELDRIKSRLDEMARANPARSTAVTDADGKVVFRTNTDGQAFYDGDEHLVAVLGRNGQTLYDAAGNVVARFGPDGVSTFDPGDGLPRQVSGVFSDGVTSFTGWVLYDGDGRSVVMTRNDKPGLVKPDIPAPFRKVNDSVSTTSGTYAEMFRFDPRRAYHDVLEVRVAVQVTPDGATTGDVRLHEINGGGVTSAVSIPANGSGTAVFEWAHGRQVGDDPGQPIYFSLEARRTAGTGEVFLYVPDASWTSSALLVDADANGNVSLV